MVKTVTPRSDYSHHCSWKLWVPAMKCATCGWSSQSVPMLLVVPVDDRCSTCWTVEVHLKEYLRSDKGQAFVIAAYADAVRTSLKEDLSKLREEPRLYCEVCGDDECGSCLCERCFENGVRAEYENDRLMR